MWNLRMSGIDVSEVSGCEYDSSFVKGLSRGNGYSFGGDDQQKGPHKDLLLCQP